MTLTNRDLEVLRRTARWRTVSEYSSPGCGPQSRRGVDFPCGLGVKRFDLPCGGRRLGHVTYAYRRDDGRSLTMLLASDKSDGFISFVAATAAAYCLT